MKAIHRNFPVRIYQMHPLNILSILNWFYPCGTNASLISTTKQFEAIFHLCFGASDTYTRSASDWWIKWNIKKLIATLVMRTSCWLSDRKSKEQKKTLSEYHIACVNKFSIYFLGIHKFVSWMSLTYFKFTINSIAQTQSKQQIHYKNTNIKKSK